MSSCHPNLIFERFAHLKVAWDLLGIRLAMPAAVGPLGAIPGTWKLIRPQA